MRYGFCECLHFTLDCLKLCSFWNDICKEFLKMKMKGGKCYYTFELHFWQKFVFMV
jgi:hypothetical protein